MAQSRRIQFNPNDYFFYSHDRMMRRQGEGPNIAFMTMDLDGHIAPEQLRTAVRAVFFAHPVLMGGVRFSLLSGRPFWRLPTNLQQAASDMADAAVSHDDFSTIPEGLDRAEALWQARCGPAWDLSAGPQMRVEQYTLPCSKTRVCIRWPHLLMDAEGAMLFLAELAARGVTQDAPRPIEGLHADVQLVDPLRPAGFFRRANLAIAGLRGMPTDKRLKIHTLFGATRPAYQDQQCLHRSWSGDDLAQIQSAAKDCVPPGPALYARYLAVCVIHALHRVFTDRNVESDAYLITMPHSISAAQRGAAATRPMQGNYLVSPTLIGRKSLIGDRRAMAEDITQQLADYAGANMSQKQWAVSWAANFSRAGFYQMLMRLPLGLEALSSGFSYYGPIKAPIDAICGARVLNLWGAGPLPTPPAWNPVFSRFGDTLNLSVTYARPAISDALASSFLRYIDEEMRRH